MAAPPTDGYQYHSRRDNQSNYGQFIPQGPPQPPARPAYPSTMHTVSSPATFTARAQSGQGPVDPRFQQNLHRPLVGGSDTSQPFVRFPNNGPPRKDSNNEEGNRMVVSHHNPEASFPMRFPGAPQFLQQPHFTNMPPMQQNMDQGRHDGKNTFQVQPSFSSQPARPTDHHHMAHLFSAGKNLSTEVRNFRLPAPEVRMPPPEVRLPAPEFRFPPPEVRLPAPEFRFPPPEVRLPPPEFRMPPPEVRLPASEVAQPPPEARLPPPEGLPVNLPQTMTGALHYNAQNVTFEPSPHTMLSGISAKPEMQPSSEINPAQPHIPDSRMYDQTSSQDRKRHVESSRIPAQLLQMSTQKDCEETRTQADEDKDWLCGWLKGRLQSTDHCKRRKMHMAITLTEARHMLRGALELFCKFQQQRQTLAAITKASAEDWNKQLSQAKLLQDQLSQTLQQVATPANIEHLSKRMAATTKKRARLRQRRKAVYQDEQEDKERHANLLRQIDHWLENVRQKEQDAKREKELKKAADETLSEVHKKLSEANRGVDVLKALQKLRQLRKDSTEKKGLYVPREVDKFFMEKTTELTRMLNAQVEIYRREERTLQVMLETEQEETKEKEEEELRLKEEAKQEHQERQVRRLLFGPKEKLDPTHPQYSHRQYYEAGQSNLGALVQIRREWDMYLVPEGTPGGSRIPAAWIYPSPPSSDTWQSALRDDG